MMFFAIDGMLDSMFLLCFDVNPNFTQTVLELDYSVACPGIFQSSPGCRSVKS